ncbi:hypothetical protein HPB52_016309 [Rhipicephalus sanguineus]|uniref:Uncharacterized protein n=1 Tax=Rhipicephalus sanguineus TaxID=34632 RepID=A0A9D4SPC8_RHISA|nr:hypothetical protein HPB52_016309 [Rhipicephalus sanguineus]
MFRTAMVIAASIVAALLGCFIACIITRAFLGQPDYEESIAFASSSPATPEPEPRVQSERPPAYTDVLREQGPKDEGSEAAQAEQTGQQTNSVSSIPRDESDNEKEQGIGSSTGQHEDMDVTRAGTSAKRTLEDVSNEDAEPERTTGGEPATKAATLRRPSLRFKPNIAAGTRPPPKPPS